MPDTTTSRSRLRAAALIVVLSATAGVLVAWRAASLSRSAGDWLMEQRGILPVPQELAIAAIDEKSIAAFGRFPWPRSVLARTIDAVSAGAPKAIAVDILFTDPTLPDEDDALAKSVGAARNVVLAAQLTDSPAHGGPAEWLLPIHSIANAAAGIGHGNVLVEPEGIAREIAVQTANDNGRTLRALAVEAVRVGDRTPEQAVSFTGKSLVLGDRVIPIESESPSVVLGEAGPVRRLGTGRMRIDFIGPAGSFGPVTYSIADILHGVVPASTFRGRYVLIGATAASQSDRVASPFLHRGDAHGDEHGVLMPGVEVLANAVATILHGRFYSETSDWVAFLWAASVAAFALFVLERTQGRFETARQAGVLVLIALAVVLVGYLEYARLLVIPPLVAALTALVCAALGSLSHRALAASAQLDASIADLSRSSEVLPAAVSVAPPPKAEWLPRGLEWKARKVRELNERLVERAGFVDQALRSVDDGLIIATADGAITFANRSAAAILNAPLQSLAGQKLIQRLGIAEPGLIERVAAGRERIEREIEIPGVRGRRYVLRIAAVPTGPDGGGEIVGIVASLSDVTRQHELQQTKNDVIALVSHEMRTPLTAIQGMTELLANYDLDAARRKEIAAVINEEVKRLTGMITGYLDITRLESGATAVRKVPVKVDALLQRIVLLHEPAAARRGIRIQLEAERGMPALLADADLLASAVENLVANAIKYGPDRAPILIRAAVEGDAIAISVSDQGCGIPEEHLSRIFEKFYRVPRVEDAGVPGAGLGLALVREIAEVHGGAVTVVSRAGAGSTFTLRLPLKIEEA